MSTNSSLPIHPYVIIAEGDLEGLPAYMIMSKVTAAMWSAGVEDKQMEAYCAAIADKDSADVIDVTKRWVKLT